MAITHVQPGREMAPALRPLESLPELLEATKVGGNSTSHQSSGQIVALLTMLKKYGSGWQTRMVRAQRSWCRQISLQFLGVSRHSTTTGERTIRLPLRAILLPSW